MNFQKLTLTIFIFTILVAFAAADLSTINITTGSSVQVGQVQNLTIEALNSSGNTFNYTGILTFSNNASATYSLVTGSGTLTGSQYAFHANDNGSIIIGITSTSTNQFSFNATNGSIISSNTNLQFTPGSFNDFTITHNNNNTAGTVFQVIFTAVDSYGNTITSFGDNTVFWKLNSENQGLIDFTSGVHSLNLNSTIQTTGSYSLEVLQGSVSETSTFTVLPNTISTFNINHRSFAVVNNTIDISIIAVDAYNNTVSDYTNLVLLSPIGDNYEWSSGSTNLSNDYTFTSGTATLIFKSKNTGSVTLSFNDAVESITKTSSLLVTESSFSISPTTGIPGDIITITGSYYEPGTILNQITFGASSATVDLTVDNTGNFTTNFTIPAITAGDYTPITLSNIQLNTNLTVQSNTELTVNNISTQYLNPEQATSKQITLSMSNTGNVLIEDINISVSNLTGQTNSIENITVGLTNFDLTMGSSQDVILTVYISSNQTLDTYSGTITITHGSTIITKDLSLVVTDETYDISVPSSLSFRVKPDSSKTIEFDVSNTGSSDLTNIQATYSGDISSKVTLSNAQNIGSGTTGSFTLTVDTNSVNEGTYSGTIKVSNDKVEKTFSITIKVSDSKLIISDLDISVNEASDDDYENNENINSIRPGDILYFDVEIENKFSDIDFDEVEVTITIKDIDDNDDIEEVSDEFTVSDDSKERVTLSLTIPVDADEGNYVVEVTVQGRDSDDDNLHEESWTLDLEVDRKSRDIEITSLEVFPEVLTCQNSIEVSVRIANIGDKDTEDAMLEVYSSELDFSTTEIGLELDEGEYLRRTFNIPLSELSNGLYVITVVADYNSDYETDVESIILEKQTCSTETPDDEEEDNSTITIVTPPTVTGNVVYGSEDNFLESDTYLLMLGLIGLLLLVVIGLMISKIK
jgi:uncharacterized membrane protein